MSNKSSLYDFNIPSSKREKLDSKSTLLFKANNVIKLAFNKANKTGECSSTCASRIFSNFSESFICTEEEYKETFGDWIHPFTGINMLDFYKELIEAEGCEAHFILSNNPVDILKYTKNVYINIHKMY